jgi:polyisoprenoid-binding protein YceI
MRRGGSGVVFGVMRSALSVMLLACAPWSALADGARYGLSADGSTVGWQTDYGQTVISGTMPVASADLVLDFDQPGASTITVILDAAGARSPFPFAAEALRGASVLDTASFPTITFAATGIAVDGNAATVKGDLTIRGETHPIRLSARFFRPPGSAEGDLSRLSVQMRGRLSRAAYGATGYSDLVSDEVRLDIVARIDRAD